MTTESDRIEIDRVELERIAAQLRHAYSHLVNGRVIDLHAFADGLLAPQIRRLERLATGPTDEALDRHLDAAAAPAPR